MNKVAVPKRQGVLLHLSLLHASRILAHYCAALKPLSQRRSFRVWLSLLVILSVFFKRAKKINYTRNRSFASSKFAHVAAAMRAGHSDDKLSKYKSIFRTRLGPCLRTDLSRVDWQRQIADSRIRYKSINTAGPRIDQIRCMFTFCCYIVCDFTFQRQSRILYYDSGV